MTAPTHHPIQVRPVANSDRADWSRIWNAYLTFYNETRDTPQHDRTWARIMDPNQPLWALVAQTPDGKIVGIANYLFHAGFWDDGNVCYLSDLFTMPDARGMGAGKALIEAIATQARAKGATEYYWLTGVGNSTARSLYDKVAKDSEFAHYTKSLD
jgi:GNAT superfamily N-acetyltransferase